MTTKTEMLAFIDDNKDSVWFAQVSNVIGEERARNELCEAFMSDCDCSRDPYGYICKFDGIGGLFFTVKPLKGTTFGGILTTL